LVAVAVTIVAVIAAIERRHVWATTGISLEKPAGGLAPIGLIDAKFGHCDSDGGSTGGTPNAGQNI
jgi:hypothetical protein